jgi:hypothetical protein
LKAEGKFNDSKDQLFVINLEWSISENGKLGSNEGQDPDMELSGISRLQSNRKKKQVINQPKFFLNQQMKKNVQEYTSF